MNFIAIDARVAYKVASPRRRRQWNASEVARQLQ